MLLLVMLYGINLQISSNFYFPYFATYLNTFAATIVFFFIGLNKVFLFLEYKQLVLALYSVF